MPVCPDCRSSIDLGLIDAGEPACPTCGVRLPNFAECTIAPAVALATAEEHAEPPPELVDYEIIRHIGRGGMGHVWEARQVRLDRKVAIKVLASARARSERFRARFAQEARTLARLSHPCIVAVFDFLATEDGCSIVMEYIESPLGEHPLSLDALIRDGQLDSNRTRHYILQVLSALHYAHERSVIHRDIKPSNVMLDEHRKVKVVDFGIAAVRDDALLAGLTLAGSMMGTVDYMAPEQGEDARSVDRRADIYSCGVMLYEMLTGRRPKGAFRRASQIAVGLDPAWDGVIERALQTDPGDRFQSAAEMTAAIQSIGTVSDAVRPPAPPDARPASTTTPPSRPPTAADGRTATEDPAHSRRRGTPPPIPHLPAARAQRQDEDEPALLRSAELQVTADVAGPADSTQFEVRSQAEHTCFACEQPVDAEAVHCPSCGQSLRFTCPLCDTQTRGGVKFCPGCGADVFVARQYETFYRQAIDDLKIAIDERHALEERLSRADEAGSALKRASKCLPNEQNARNLLADARSLSERLSWELAERAFQRKNYAGTLACCERVLELNAGHVQARRRRDEVGEIRERTLARGRQLFDAGKLDQAVSALEAGREQFPDDPGFASLLEDCRTAEARTSGVREKFERLKDERKLFELYDHVAKLRKSNPALRKRYEKYARSLKQQLDRILAEVKAARAFLHSGDWEEALRRGLHIQEFVVDCKGANDLVKRARRSRGGIGTVLRLIFLAAALLAIVWVTRGLWPDSVQKTVVQPVEGFLDRAFSSKPDASTPDGPDGKP